MTKILPAVKDLKFVSRIGRLELSNRRPKVVYKSFQHPRNLVKRRAAFKRVFAGPPLTANSGVSTLKLAYYIAFREHRPGGFSNVKAVDPIQELGARSRVNHKMKSWVQFLSTPTADTPGTTLYLHFDTKRYIIGHVAEGTQRVAIQRKQTLARIGDIFLTGTIGWENSGGILGMILTLADATASAAEALKEYREKKKNRTKEDVEEPKPWLNLHGGKNLAHMVATARRFVFRKGMPLYTNEFREKADKQRKDWEPTWKDEYIKVWAMVLQPENGSRRKRSHDEFQEDAFLKSTEGKLETPDEREDRYHQMRSSVVSSMFESEWRLDALIKRKLSEVKLPASIFYRDENGSIQKYTGPTMDEDPSTPDIEVLTRNPWPGAMIETLPPTTPSTSSLCYFIKTHPQRGKFDAKAAIALGVTPGKDFGLLAGGKNVVAKDGKVVTSDQVLSQGNEGSGLAIIELPDNSYVGPLLARDEWSSKEVMSGIGAVIWILGPGVVEDPRLQKFMQEHTELKHVVSSKDCCSNYLALNDAAAAAIRLHLIDPEHFPIPVHSNEVPSSKVESSRPYTKARAGHIIQMQPNVEVQDDKIVRYLDTAEVVNETPTEVRTLAAKAREEIASVEYRTTLDENQKDIPSKDAEVTTLGTGSALPSKYRNVSATILRVPGYGTYLFDCGENTLGQLKRVFGDELPEILRDLKVIWISHLHADHHLGTASVIRAWAQETKKDELTKNTKLIVASDDGMISWLQEYSQVEDYGQERVEHITINHGTKYRHDFQLEQTKKIGLTSIRACPVDHCKGALAVVFNFPHGFKVAYSGDCRPNEQFTRIGEGATLLIHEATFDDELQGDAQAKKHCTTSEALDVGKRMNARRILLTHFSQRYQKIPVMDSHGGKDQVAIVAFDYMRVKLEDFAKMEVFKPALVKLYEEKSNEWTMYKQ